MEIIATLEETSPVVSGISQKTGTSWKKTNIVVSTSGDFTRRICMMAFNETCDAVAGIPIGSIVRVRYDINARRWEKDGKSGWINDITARKVSRLEVTNNINEDF